MMIHNEIWQIIPRQEILARNNHYSIITISDNRPHCLPVYRNLTAYILYLTLH